MRLILPLIFGLSLLAQGRNPSKLSPVEMKKVLLGDHRLYLNWIQLDTKTYGSASVEIAGNQWKLHGEHRSTKNRDALVLDGVISSITSNGFYFQGRLTTQVSYHYVGKVCERRGLLYFAYKAKEDAWVLQEASACGSHTDKVVLSVARP